MTSPFVRRSTTITAAVVFAGLVAAPFAASAAAPAAIPAGLVGSVTVDPDPDGTGQPVHADPGRHHVRDHHHAERRHARRRRPHDHRGRGRRPPELPRLGPGLGGRHQLGPAELDVRDLDITTQGFEGGSNSGGLLNGIYMYRAGGSLTNVSVDGISHGNGIQEGNAISIRNRVAGDNIDVPRAQVDLADIDVTNYQKTGLLLDGNLTFTVKNAHVGQGAGPQGQPNPSIAANSLQISRGASGSVTDSTFKLNSHDAGNRRAPLQRQEGRLRSSHHQRRRAGDHGHQRLQRLQHDRHRLHDAGRRRHRYERGRQRRRRGLGNRVPRQPP